MRHLCGCPLVVAAVLLLVPSGTTRAQDQPKPAQSEASQSEAGQSEAGQSEAGQSEAGQSEAGQSAGENESASSDSQVSSVASAMSTIFSPTRAPKRKTMGLLQRSFLDLADQGDRELQLAIVVDGTKSMRTELANVRKTVNKMLEDLRKYRTSEVSVAVVVYRDAGSPTPDVRIEQKAFTSDPKTISAAVNRIQAESGEPYFYEVPDLGLQVALGQLEWSRDDQVAKWILLFGDAPPYPESYEDKKFDARRRCTTPILVSMAKERNIRINCILCTSNEDVSGSEWYNDTIQRTRDFMNELCAGTDGLMLDLSEEAIRTAMIEAGKQPEVQLAQIEPIPISAIDLAAVRQEDLEQKANIKRVSLAVLPHMPLQTMSFEPDNPAVQVSTALRTKLSRVPGVRIASSRDIREQLRRVRGEGISDDKLVLRSLAARLGVNFVVWGSLAPDKATVQTAAYRKDNGQQYKPITLSRHSDDIAYALIAASAQSAPDDKVLSQLFSNMKDLQGELSEPLAKDAATSDELLTAIEALEQALAYEAGSSESLELLAKAERAVENAITAESRPNAVAHWLLANVAYNQASSHYRSGEREAGNTRKAIAINALRVAGNNVSSVRSPSLLTEIQADYYLLERRNPEKAVERYLAMTKPDQPSQTQLRGHWMLAGVYAGDWGYADNAIVNADESRRHVIEILANWPDSPEAKLLKEWLRWDESKEQTEFNYLPRLNMQLS